MDDKQTDFTVQSFLDAWDASVLANPAQSVYRRLEEIVLNENYKGAAARTLMIYGRVVVALPGPVIAKGRDAWIASPKGGGGNLEQYTKNRLEAAFLAGVQFAEKGKV